MSDTTDLFLITGATGKTGAPTVGLLRERGFRVRALVHNLDERTRRLRELGAEVVHGDLLDFDAVSSAMVGVTAAYFCYPLEPGRLLEATAIFAQAATEAGVRALVNMSQITARRDATHAARDHWIAERLFDRTHMMTTHLRPTMFAELLSWQWARHDGQGVLRLPFGNGRHAPIAASADLPPVIAAILANPAPHDRQIYSLYGPEELDHHAIAQKMSQTLGIPVRYEPVDFGSFAAALRAQGAPPFQVEFLSTVARDYRNGVFAGTNNLVEVIGGRPPITVEQYTAAARASFESDGQYAAWESVTDELSDVRSLATC